MSLSQQARSTLVREFEDAGPADEIDLAVRGELRGLLNHYISHLIGHRPKMHAFFGMLMSG